MFVSPPSYLELGIVRLVERELFAMEWCRHNNFLLCSKFVCTRIHCLFSESDLPQTYLFRTVRTTPLHTTPCSPSSRIAVTSVPYLFPHRWLKSQLQERFTAADLSALTAALQIYAALITQPSEHGSVSPGNSLLILSGVQGPFSSRSSGEVN